MGSQSRATILLVEDDPGIARLERLRLERAGYAVATAATAEEGLRKVAEGGIELIVLDQQLTPGTSGLEFFRQVKAAGYNVPAILVTGMQEENLLVEAMRAGVRDFVPKTQHFLNHLEPIVTRVLDQVRTERELAESRIVARENEERRRELEREIAHRKRVEQALKEADVRKDQFLAMLAHELRNPLAPISNAVQIMKAEGLSGPYFQWSVKVIEDQIKQMTRMVDDLLDVSRITRGKVVLQKEPIDLEVVVDLAVEASQPLIKDCKHQLTVTLPPDPILLEVNPARMAQVLSNLLNNAAKYTDEGGEIALTAEPAGREVLIRIRDNGIGIAPELLPHVFDMFTQADQTLSRSRGGLGIGLTLVRSLVEMHDGRVGVHSDGPRPGERVHRLPPRGGPARRRPERCRRSGRRRPGAPAPAPADPGGRRQPEPRHQPGRPPANDGAGRRRGLRRRDGPRAGATASPRRDPARHRPARHGWLRGGPPLPGAERPRADDAGGHDRIRQGRGPAPLPGGRIQRPPRQARQPGGPPDAPQPAGSPRPEILIPATRLPLSNHAS